MLDCRKRIGVWLFVATVFASAHASNAKAQVVTAQVVTAQVVTGQVVADDASLKSTALGLTPQDAAFFSTSLNLRKAWDGFLKGSLVTRLRELPYVQRLEAEVLAKWENPEGQMQSLKDNLKNPNVKNLLDLIVDMNSREYSTTAHMIGTNQLEG